MVRKMRLTVVVCRCAHCVSATGLLVIDWAFYRDLQFDDADMTFLSDSNNRRGSVATGKRKSGDEPDWLIPTCFVLFCPLSAGWSGKIYFT
ncbi:hypothetical protein [Prevotella brunnea]|nr:hypothetical protein [Prevotella brunnea]